MERTTQETWAKRIERWKESGLTAGEFATEVGINIRSLRLVAVAARLAAAPLALRLAALIS